MNFSGNVGSSPRISAPSAPPSPASPEPTANVPRNTLLTSMPSPRRDARIVDRGAQAAAEARPREDRLQHDREDAADDDDEQTIGADTDAGDLEATAQELRKPHELLLRAERVVDAGDGDEHQPDREQHLVEVRPPVQRSVERRLEHGAERRGEQRTRAAMQRGTERRACSTARRSDSRRPSRTRHARG